MGDGGLIEFPNVEDSVRWAIAFQTAMAARNAGKRRRCDPGPRSASALPMSSCPGDDRFGAAVGFVVRLQQAAPPGGIAITHSVRWQLVKQLAAEFDRTEWVEFKNMDEQFEIWLWRGRRRRGAAEARDARPGSVIGRSRWPRDDACCRRNRRSRRRRR